MIERLDRVVDRVIDLAGVASRSGRRNAEQERCEVSAKGVAQRARRIRRGRCERAVKEELATFVTVGAEVLAQHAKVVTILQRVVVDDLRQCWLDRAHIKRSNTTFVPVRARRAES